MWRLLFEYIMMEQNELVNKKKIELSYDTNRSRLIYVADNLRLWVFALSTKSVRRPCLSQRFPYGSARCGLNFNVFVILKRVNKKRLVCFFDSVSSLIQSMRWLLRIDCTCSCYVELRRYVIVTGLGHDWKETQHEWTLDLICRN